MCTISFCRSLASLDLWPPNIDNNESAREQCKEKVDERGTPTRPTQRERENECLIPCVFLASRPDFLFWSLFRDLRDKIPNGSLGLRLLGEDYQYMFVCIVYTCIYSQCCILICICYSTRIIVVDTTDSCATGCVQWFESPSNVFKQSNCLNPIESTK